MNIFFFDKDPVKCAEQLCDKHVVKMTTETVQIISTAYFILSGQRGVYKPTHKHHPCVIWATKSEDNFNWLLSYAVSLGGQYTKRYSRQHLAITKLSEWIPQIPINSLKFSELAWSNPPQCMPEQYKQPDTIQAYRNYYTGEKLRFAFWDYSNKPTWVNK